MMAEGVVIWGGNGPILKGKFQNSRNCAFANQIGWERPAIEAEISLRNLADAIGGDC